MLIDGLDEARLRVTPEAFEAFLDDIFVRSNNRRLPTVLFGRSGSVQDTWLMLADKMEVPVLEIGYFGSEASIEFAEAKLRAANPSCTHIETEHKAIRLLLDGIRSQTESDGDRFAGYAPVLQAVAERVSREKNPAALVAEIERGVQSITLQHVAFSILKRERSKFDPMTFEDHDIAAQLYLADEQLSHLASRVYGTSPPDLPPMNPRDAQTYENALQTWVADHPFLAGQNRPSSAVFDAVITTWALRKGVSNEAKEAAVKRELGRGFAANPFLSEIYMNEIIEEEDRFLPSEHIGIVYSSLRARLSLGDSASLLIEITEQDSNEDPLRADVEITHSRRGDDRAHVLDFRTEPSDLIRLGIHVADIEIIAPHSHVDIGPGNEAKLIAPISIQCDTLSIDTTRVIVESSPTRSDSSVFLEASEFCGPMMTSVPVLRGQATLASFWPNVRSHPWTNFAVEPTSMKDPRIDEALRRFRKFVISFRAHGRGSLARFKEKIEHERMTKMYRCRSTFFSECEHCLDLSIYPEFRRLLRVSLAATVQAERTSSMPLMPRD